MRSRRSSPEGSVMKQANMWSRNTSDGSFPPIHRDIEGHRECGAANREIAIDFIA